MSLLVLESMKVVMQDMQVQFMDGNSSCYVNGCRMIHLTLHGPEKHV